MEKDSVYYYGMGLDYYKEGNMEKALENFLHSLHMEIHFKTYERIYQVLTSLGNYKEAREYLLKAYELNNKNEKICVEFAKVIFEEGKVLQAEEILKEVIKRIPTYGPAKKLLIKVGEAQEKL